MKTTIIKNLNVLDLCIQAILLFGLSIGIVSLFITKGAPLGILLVLPFIGGWQLGTGFIRMLGDFNSFFAKYVFYATAFLVFFGLLSMHLGTAFEGTFYKKTWIYIIMVVIPTIAAFVYFFKTLDASIDRG